MPGCKPQRIVIDIPVRYRLSLLLPDEVKGELIVVHKVSDHLRSVTTVDKNRVPSRLQECEGLLGAFHR